MLQFFPYLGVQTTVDLGGRVESDVIELMAHASLMVKFIMLLLFTFSVMSWAIVFWKYRMFRKAKVENEIFLEIFFEGKGMNYVFRESRQLKNSPLAAQFRLGYAELVKVRKTAAGNPEGNPGGRGQISSDGVTEHLKRSLERAVLAEATRMSSNLAFLATTGNSAPFIGLFGTVWGIMNAFRGIGLKGSASLAVVAPGIAEALIATAAGLAAAIPAVIFYNYFSNKLARQEADMNGFSADFLNLADFE